ncbi:hypothetical protein D3C75_849460 [compost metagenome]
MVIRRSLDKELSISALSLSPFFSTFIRMEFITLNRKWGLIWAWSMSSSALRLRAWVSVISWIMSVIRSSIWSKDLPSRPTSSCPRMEERTSKSPCCTRRATLSRRTSGTVKA